MISNYKNLVDISITTYDFMSSTLLRYFVHEKYLNKDYLHIKDLRCSLKMTLLEVGFFQVVSREQKNERTV